MMDFITTPTIGEILREEFMEPMKISAYRLAQEIHVPVSRIQDILHDRRKITVDTSLRLAKLNIPFTKCTLFADQVHPFRKASAGFPEGNAVNHNGTLST